MSSRRSLGLAALLLAGCGTDEAPLAAQPIGERWYIAYQSTGFNMDDRGARERLERATASGRVVVDYRIEKYRFYAPDCVIYHTTLRDHQVLAVCGDRTPVAIARAVSLDDWSFDDDGVRRVNPPWNDHGRFMQRHEVLPLERVIALARQQPSWREHWAQSVPANARMEPVQTDRPADLRRRDPRTGESPLMPLVRGGHFDLADAMIDAGADVNLANDRGVTPLMAAADDWGRSDGRLLARLIGAGARLDAQDSMGQTALMIAARHASFVNVKQLLAAGANGALRDNDGRTAAMHVADQSNAELIRILRAAEQR